MKPRVSERKFFVFALGVLAVFIVLICGCMKLVSDVFGAESIAFKVVAVAATLLYVALVITLAVLYAELQLEQSGRTVG